MKLSKHKIISWASSFFAFVAILVAAAPCVVRAYEPKLPDKLRP